MNIKSHFFVTIFCPILRLALPVSEEFIDNKFMAESARKLIVNEAPSIYSHHDFREYLREVIAFRKQRDKRFSLRQFAKALGITHAYLSQILNDKRKIQMDLADNIARQLNLEEDDRRYFQLLTVLSDSHSPMERDRAFQLVQKFSLFRKQSPKEFETYKYLSHWYFVAIRELAQREDFNIDPKWIKSKLAHKISTGEIKSAVDFLLKHEFIVQQKDGRYFLPKKEIYCERGAFQLSLGQFHREMLNLTANAIDDIDPTKRQILGFTLAIPNSKINKIKEILDKAQKEIAKLESEGGDMTDVYHVTLAAIPLAGGDQ